MPRSVIAGGAGFIGTALARELLRRGHEVLCIDTLETASLDALRPLMRRSRFSAQRRDVIHPITLDGPIDAVYNLACPGSPRDYQKNPLRTLRTCTEGTMNLLELALAHDARFVQASTSEVYGNPEMSPQPESYTGRVKTIGPRAPYNEGKRAAETLCATYVKQFGVDARIARIFNTYGPGMRPDDGRMIPTFVAQALAEEPITVRGRGDQSRSLCYIDDTVEALIRLMEVPDVGVVPVNIGNPDERTVRGIAHAVRRAAGSGSRVVFTARDEDDPRMRRPDIARAHRLLDWTPTTPFAEGLGNVIAHFRRHHRKQGEVML